MLRILSAGAIALALFLAPDGTARAGGMTYFSAAHAGSLTDVSAARRGHRGRNLHRAAGLRHLGYRGHASRDPIRRAEARMDIAGADRDGRWGASVDRPSAAVPRRAVTRWAARRPVARHSGPVRAIVTRAVAAVTGLASLPGELAAKVAEIAGACPGFHVISGCRPGAKVAGTNINSLHASCRAADIAGPNYACAYARLAGWPGGASTDPERVAHIHLSWAPGSREQGARFRHGGGGGRHVHRYARNRYVRHARWRG